MTFVAVPKLWHERGSNDGSQCVILYGVTYVLVTKQNGIFIIMRSLWSKCSGYNWTGSIYSCYNRHVEIPLKMRVAWRAELNCDGLLRQVRSACSMGHFEKVVDFLCPSLCA